MLKYMAFLMTILGTLITISFSSIPLIAWLGLELNSMAFIPLLKNESPSSNETMMKYFFIQTISSSLFLISSLLLSQYTLNFLLTLSYTSTSSIIMTIALLIKLGMAPFHFWMFPLINMMNWLPFTMFLTWQKIAPLSIMTYSSLQFIIIPILVSVMISPLMMINQNLIKMILGYTSIIHLAWLMVSFHMSIYLFLQYLFIYMIIFISTSLFFSFIHIQHVSQISYMNNKHKLIMLMNTLSLSGFPPLAMFMAKMMLMIQIIQNSSFNLILLMLLVSTLLSTYAYIYLNFPFLMTTLFTFPLSKTYINYKIMFFIFFMPSIIIPFSLLTLF